MYSLLSYALGLILEPFERSKQEESLVQNWICIFLENQVVFLVYKLGKNS